MRQYRHKAIGILLLSLSLAAPSPARADNSAADVKAAFIYNFAKFVEWPPATFSTGNGSLQLCLWGDSALTRKLQTLHGREAQGRVIQIKPLANGNDWQGCHIIFLSDSGPSPRSQMLQTLNRSAVLTISDAQDFTRQGGMIGLFVEGNRVQFSINLNATQQSGLKLSARVLQLARNAP